MGGGTAIGRFRFIGLIKYLTLFPTVLSLVMILVVNALDLVVSDTLGSTVIYTIISIVNTLDIVVSDTLGSTVI